MSFGLWVEPEMISEDSDLFRKHPDWALRIQGREMHEGRNQYVLDMGRDDVVAYLTDVFTAVLGSADIKYIKWDMNRNISDANSAALPPNRQGEVMHRYILGVYKLMENLVSTFPNILFEAAAAVQEETIPEYCIICRRIGEAIIQMQWKECIYSTEPEWFIRQVQYAHMYRTYRIIK